MSLPDTVFIFVLALIIFGPKKLPEIGRQLGRLVGEFRRASNEFKFQIEEELRQADFNDQRSSQKTIAAPIQDAAQLENGSTDPIFPQNSEDPAENIAVGQHPNIDTLDTSELNSPAIEPLGHQETTNLEISEEKTGGEIQVESAHLDSVPAITPAANVQARTKAHYVPADSDNDSLSLPFPQQVADEALPPTEIPTPTHSHIAPNEAEITHG